MTPAFIAPCLPSPADSPPTGSDWVHEIKHDGYRLMARRDPVSVGIRLLTRNGHDWGARYPLIVQAVNKLKARSCLIDGEAVCCNERGVPTFEKLRHRSNDQSVILIAFDLLELDGEDLRREPFETRKATLASLVRGSLPGVQFNQHLTHRGDIVFEHACKMGLEGIVSKRLGSVYRSGRTSDWLKFKNPAAPAVKRGAEEDWARKDGSDVNRTHFLYRIDMWTIDGEHVIEHLAGIEDFQLAMATYRAACARWPGASITLRQGAKVIEDNRRERTA